MQPCFDIDFKEVSCGFVRVITRYETRPYSFTAGSFEKKQTFSVNSSVLGIEVWHSSRCIGPQVCNERDQRLHMCKIERLPSSGDCFGCV
jgi:hypothetical protein